MGVAEDLGDALARDVLAALEELGDERFFDKVGKILADSSPTMQEAFMTAVKVRLAERRGRAFLTQALNAKRGEGTAPTAPYDGGTGH
jgi:hypothetical protein